MIFAPLTEIEQIMPIAIMRLLLVYSIYSITLLPIMPNGINSGCMIAFICLSLIYSAMNRRQTPSPDWRWALLMGGNFIIMCITLIYTVDFAEGISDIRILLPGLLFPVCFFLLPGRIKLTGKELGTALLIFWLSTIVLALWLYLKLWQMNLLKWDDSEQFTTIFREAAGSISRKGATYIAMYMAFASCISVHQFIKSRSVSFRLANILSLLLQLFLLFQMAARMPIIGAFTGLIIILFWRLRSALLKVSLLVLFTILFGFLARYVPSIHSRVLEVQNTLLAPPVAEHYNSTNLRVGIYECSWESIKANWLTGIGTGGSKKILSACYARIPTDAYKLQFYDTHNQYVYFWLLNGIFALVLFIASLIYANSLAVKSGDAVMLFFLILMPICFISENVLTQQAGAVFYYFFLCLMVHYHKVNRTSAQQK